MVMKVALRDRIKKCIHHWIVRPPDGATSWGECQKCGRRKRFSNRLEGGDRTNNSDIFTTPGSAWRSTDGPRYYEPGILTRHEEARLASAIH